MNYLFDHHRSKFFTFPSFILMFILLFGCQQAGKPEFYNILLITIDDLRPELGCYGADHVHSPNIDQLAEEGIIFSNAYCSVSWCAPSRTSLMTGLRPETTGVMDLQTHFRKNIPGITTLPQYFKNNGFISLGFGKLYHNSPDMQDSLSWTRPCWIPPFDHPILAYASEPNLSMAKVNATHKANVTECADVADNAYPDGMITEKAIEALREINLTEKPFFLGVGFYKPHLPFTAPKKYWDLYNPQEILLTSENDLPVNASPYIFRSWSEPGSYQDINQSEPYPDSLSRHLIQGYWACTSFIDAQVGKLTEELKKLGLYDNTIIVIWGDHGWKLGEFGRWSKHSVMELDTRVPLIMRIPGHESQIMDDIVETIDIYPTLTLLNGLTVPDHLEGEDLFNKKRDYALSRIPRDSVTGISIRTPEYRYIEWRLNEQPENVLFKELYDYENNRIEKTNMINDSTGSSISEELQQLIHL